MDNSTSVRVEALGVAEHLHNDNKTCHNFNDSKRKLGEENDQLSVHFFSFDYPIAFKKVLGIT